MNPCLFYYEWIKNVHKQAAAISAFGSSIWIFFSIASLIRCNHHIRSLDDRIHCLTPGKA